MARREHPISADPISNIILSTVRVVSEREREKRGTDVLGVGVGCVIAFTDFCATTESSEERTPLSVDVRLNSVESVSGGCVEKGANCIVVEVEVREYA